MTELIEFKNRQGEILRALLDKAGVKRGVVFVHGFERTSVEKRFKVMVDNLKGKVNLFRFDMADCGLSDGDFKNFTIDKSARELGAAIKVFQRRSKTKYLAMLAHSVGGCIVLHYLLNYYKPSGGLKIDKLIFFAPALNQRELLRYWFVQNNRAQRKTSWSDYRRYLNEKKFLESVKIKQRLVKAHVLSNKYFLENYQQDYNDYLDKLDKTYRWLVIHGDKDEKVPLASNRFKRVLKVRGGDHDLQRPDMVKQWLKEVINFIQS